MLDYFMGRKKQVDIAPIMRRIIDLTTPNHTAGVDLRLERRYNRAFPVLLTPWRKGTPHVEDSLVLFTRDLSDRGIGLISMKHLEEEHYVITTWPPQNDVTEPYHFLTMIRENRQIAVGLWVAGFEVTDVLNRGSRRCIAKLNQAAACTLQVLNEELAGTVS